MLMQRLQQIAVVCLLIAGFSNVACQEQVINEEIALQGEQGVDMAQMFGNGGFEDIQRMLQSLLGGESIHREDQKRTRMLQALPEALREDVDQVNRQFHELAEQISIEKFFNRYGQAILDILKSRPGFFLSNMSTVVDGIADLNEMEETLVKQLEGLVQATKNHSFLNLVFPDRLGGNPQDWQNMLMQRMNMSHHVQPAVYAREEVAALRENLEKLVKASQSDEKMNEALQAAHCSGIITVLRSIEAGDARAVALDMVDVLRESFQTMRKKMLAVMRLLVDQRVALVSGEQEDVREALEYWAKELKSYRLSITEFLSLASTASIDLRNVLQSMSWTNEVISIFFTDYIDEDNKDHKFRAGLYNAALWAAMSGGIVLNLRGEAAYGELQKSLLGQGEFKNFKNPMDSPEYMLMSLVQFMPTMIQAGGSFGKPMHRLLRATLRVCAAWGWYTVHNKGLKTDSWLPWKWSVAANDTSWLSWDAKDIFMRTAWRGIVGEGQGVASSVMHMGWNRTFGSKTREKMNDYSMGLVNSQLIDLGLDIFVPWLMTQKKGALGIDKIADFKNSDFMSKHRAFYRHLHTQYNGDADRIQAQFYPYLKYRLLEYALANAGQFWGSAIARYFKRPIIAGAKAVYNGASEVVGYIMDDGWEWDLDNKLDDRSAQDGHKDGHKNVNPTGYISPEDAILKNAKKGAIEEGSWNWEDIKDILVSIFHEYSPFRSSIVGFLKTSGQIGDTVVEPQAVNDAMVSCALNFLTDRLILKHSQAARLFWVYGNNQDNIGVFIDELVEVLKESAVGAAGGIVGRGIGQHIAWKLMDKYLIDSV